MPKLGLMGSGVRALDPSKVQDGVVHEITAGRLKGIELRVRTVGPSNPLHTQFIDDWATGELKKLLEEKDEEPDTADLNRRQLRATQTPEYVATVLIADVPGGIEIPEHVESVELEAVSDWYTKADGGGFRLKKNRKPVVPYSPEIGVWLIERYPELTDWAWRFAGDEAAFLEDREDVEGNS